MANQPTGGSVAQTAAVAMPTGAGLIVLQYLCHPTWPPPDAVLTIASVTLIPLAHLIGRALCRRVENWTAAEDAPPPPVTAQPSTPIPPRQSTIPQPVSEDHDG